MVVSVLLIAGDQAPVTPLFDVVGNAPKVSPLKIAATCVNVGITFGFTTIVIFTVAAHWPASGVKA